MLVLIGFVNWRRLFKLWNIIVILIDWLLMISKVSINLIINVNRILKIVFVIDWLFSIFKLCVKVNKNDDRRIVIL